METVIRPALPSEAETLTEIALASKRYWQYPEEWLKLWSEELTVSGNYIQTSDVFCAEVGKAVVGWYALSFSEEVCALDYFWVLPERMGCGVGRTMMRHAKRLLATSQAGAMTVIADPNAESFYVKMGFEKVGVHPSTPVGRYIPVLIFRKG